jgi:hypothetical protein
LFGNDRRSALFHARIQGGKKAAHRRGHDSFCLHIACSGCDGTLVQFRIEPSVKLISAVYKINVSTYHVSQVRRPAHQWGDAAGGRQRNANHANLEQFAPFNKGVGELRGTDHDGRYFGAAHTLARGQTGDRAADATAVVAVQ